MNFSTLCQALDPVELIYISSADYLNNIDIVNLNKEQRNLINGFTDLPERETTRDFLLNKKLRTDIWVRDPTPLSSDRQNKLIREQRFMIAKTFDTTPKTISTSLGQIKLYQAIYNPVLNALAEFQIKTIKQIEMHCREAKISLDQITQAILVLCSKGFIVAIQDDHTNNKVNAQTDRLNAYLLERATRNQEGDVLTSPVTGGAINFSYLGLLFILALKKGKKTPKASAEFVWNRIKKQRGSIYIGDKLVRDAGSAKAELAISAQNFYEKENDLLKAMKII
ncbi:MAG TPA: hypothetical protein EYQ22_10315 [Gammaproteobacteria bacterium]|nr:hypothetical protein [Gammaproteobacteria bacterium]